MDCVTRRLHRLVTAAVVGSFAFSSSVMAGGTADCSVLGRVCGQKLCRALRSRVRLQSECGLCRYKR